MPKTKSVVITYKEYDFKVVFNIDGNGHTQSIDIHDPRRLHELQPGQELGRDAEVNILHDKKVYCGNLAEFDGVCLYVLGQACNAATNITGFTFHKNAETYPFTVSINCSEGVVFGLPTVQPPYDHDSSVMGNIEVSPE